MASRAKGKARVSRKTCGTSARRFWSEGWVIALTSWVRYSFACDFPDPLGIAVTAAVACAGMTSGAIMLVDNATATKACRSLVFIIGLLFAYSFFEHYTSKYYYVQ